MTKISRNILFVGVASIFLAACANERSPIKETIGVGTKKALLTSAEVKTTHYWERQNENGFNRSKTIICAEPSADVVKVFSDATDFGGGLSVSGLPSGISPELALAISRSTAEAAAQLGERLGTIQLLRDSTYRACEAYANGAISRTSYAAILSRYDDAMVTLMLGEMAAGAFGRDLAAVSTSANGSSEGGVTRTRNISDIQSVDITRKIDTIREVGERLEEVRDEVDEAQAELAEEVAKEKPDADRVRRLEDHLDETRNEERTRTDNLNLVLKATAESQAAGQFAENIGQITGRSTNDVSANLAKMARKYIENINSDALTLACLTELAGTGSKITPPKDGMSDTPKSGMSDTPKSGMSETVSAKPTDKTEPETISDSALSIHCPVLLKESLSLQKQSLEQIIKLHMQRVNNAEQAGNLTEQINRLKANIDGAQEIKKALGGTKTPTARQKAAAELLAARDAVVRTEKAIADKNGELIKAKKDLQTVTDKIPAAEKKVADLKAIANPTAEQKAELEAAENALAKLRSDKEGFDTTIKGLEARLLVLKDDDLKKQKADLVKKEEAYTAAVLEEEKKK